VEKGVCYIVDRAGKQRESERLVLDIPIRLMVLTKYKTYIPGSKGINMFKLIFFQFDNKAFKITRR